ncbi:PQQ-binding-like beta-propeller repeat protein [Paenibacillus fonticola]|uniref:S-layer homology domain-containing protein n=1 Tax=Paenibacillus fonticola TaxID=379896 RepID=UPI000361DD74|nr:PQQ-binding-like beta-propeller repeat protein [Paenibacillus fonticola]
MNLRDNKVWILTLAIWLGFTGLLPATIIKAAELPFAQGTGYGPGAYDYEAAQPTAFNWARQSRFVGSPDHDVKWSFAAEGEVYSTPAIGADGTLYVGSYDGKLYALNSKTGKLKWAFETAWAIASSPAIGADGTIYIGSGDGKLYALDPNAPNDDEREKWSFATGNRIYSSPAIGQDGTIYISSYDGKLYALDPDADDDKRELWSYEIGGQLDSSPAVGADGTIYVGSGDGIFYALDPGAEDDTQRLKWSFEPETAEDCLWMMDGPCSFYSSPAIGANGDVIYVGSDDGYVYALDPNADDDEDRLKWSYETWGSISSSPAIGKDGTVYVGSSDGLLYALDPDAVDDNNREKWSFDTSVKNWNMIVSSPVVGADGTVYIASIGWYGDGTLFALDSHAQGENERVKWSFATTREIRSSPVIGPDGTVYIGSDDDKLYALGTRLPIAAPDGVAADAGENEVKLTWEAVDGAVGYRLYYYQGTAAPVQSDQWELVNEDELITGTDYSVKNLTAGQLYWFTVQAIDKDGTESDRSEQASGTPYANIAEVIALAPVQVAKGTQLAELYWPAEVQVRLTDGSEADVPVSWDLVNTDYDPGQVGAYPIIGELRLPRHIRNPNNLNAELTVSVMPGNDAKLRNLQINGEPLQGFKSEIYTYNLRFPYPTEQITVTAATYELEAAVEIVGGNLQWLQVGGNLIEIIVTAENGDTQRYTLSVIREPDAAAPVWPPGSELIVSDITQTSVKLTWPAAQDHFEVVGYRLYLNDGIQADQVSSKYKYSVTESVYTYTMTGLAPDTSYRFTVKAYDAAGNDSEPGLSKTAVTLRHSSSGDGDSYRGSGGGSSYLSRNANLKSLEVWVDDKRLSLTPAFRADILSYTIKTEAKQIELKISAEYSKTKVTWQDQTLGDGIKIDLQEGENVIPLQVKAEDGTLKTYTLTIERKSPQSAEPETSPISFNDIAGHWAESYIQRAASKGIVSGYPDGSFEPNRPLTRVEFAVMLAGALKLEGEAAALAFTDHDQIGEWANQGVAQVLQAGIIKGYEDGSFRPNTHITRAEMAAMITRALQLQPDTDVSTSFADDGAIPQWAKGAVEAIRELGLVAGRGENHFVPNDTATRVEATVIVLKMLELQ